MGGAQVKFKRNIQFAKSDNFANTRRDGAIERAAKHNYTSFSLRCKHSPERVSISGESITLDKKQPTRKYHSVSYPSLRKRSFPRPSWLVGPRCVCVTPLSSNLIKSKLWHLYFTNDEQPTHDDRQSMKDCSGLKLRCIEG